jgi:hypothetical protein
MKFLRRGGIMNLKRLMLIPCLLAVAVSPYAQEAPTSVTQDPTAVALAVKSLAALAGNTTISDVTLTGTATRVAGSDTGSGTVTLRALGTSNSRVDLSLSDGAFSEIRTAPNGAPQGSWLAADGAYNSMAMHNCLTDSAWFFPALTVLSQTSNPYLSITYMGQETKNDISVQHLHFAANSKEQANTVADPLPTLSSTDVYLDSSSLLPVALSFNTHPDNNALLNTRVEVDLSNYQVVNGVQIPFRIQKFLNGSLFLDMTIQSASVNTGLTLAIFSAD